MATRKRPQEEKDPNAPSLKEVLSDGSDTIGPTYASVDSLAILRIIYTVSALGGMVTFWVDSVNQRICFSMRLWGEARSFQVDDPGQFSLISEPLVGKLSPHLQKKKFPPPPLPPVKPVSTPLDKP